MRLLQMLHLFDKQDLHKYIVDYHDIKLPSLPYPQEYARKSQYSQLGLLVEDILAEGFGGRDVSKLTPALISNLESLHSDLSAYGELLREYELEMGGLKGHPDLMTLDGSHIFEIKYTGKPDIMMKDFLVQLCSYGAMAPFAKTLHLVLPNQGIIFDYEISEWKNRDAFKSRLMRMAEEVTSRKLVYGYTIKKDKTLHRSLEKLELPYNIPIQIYLNGNICSRVKIADEDIALTSYHLSQSHRPSFVHAPYCINLCQPRKYKNGYMRDLLIKVIQVSSACMFKGVVFHVGKLCTPDCTMKNFRKATRKIAHHTTKECPLLIETPAGQGSETLCTPEELVTFISRIRSRMGDEKDKIGLCIDTCHVFATGYRPLEYLQRIIDLGALPLVKLIHFNGSRAKLGSRKDQHGPIWGSLIDDGELFTFGQICTKHNIPMVRE